MFKKVHTKALSRPYDVFKISRQTSSVLTIEGFGADLTILVEDVIGREDIVRVRVDGEVIARKRCGGGDGACRGRVEPGLI